MRFIIKMKGRQRILEAENLEQAAVIADHKYPRWMDITYCNYENGEEV